MEEEYFHLLAHPSNVQKTAGAEPSQNQESRFPSRSPTRVVGTQVFKLSPVASKVNYHETESEAE